jgi:hypothetical protein
MAVLTTNEKERLNRAIGHVAREVDLGARLAKLLSDGTYTGSMSATDLTGTTQTSFTVNSASGYPRLVLSSPDTGTGNYAITIAPPATLTGNRAVTMKDAAGEITLNEGVQTLSNKTLAATTMSGTLTTLAITSATGVYNINLSASTGAFTTPTGAFNVAGDTVVAAGIDVSCASGNTLFDFVLGTGIFRTTTGENTLGGNVTISGSKTFTTGSGTTTINGTISVAANVNAACVAGTSAFDWSLGTGIFKTTSGANTLGGPVSIGNVTGTSLTIGTNTVAAIIINRSTLYAMRVGAKGAAGATGSAVTFAATQDFDTDGQLDIVSVFGESSSNLTSAYSAKCGRFRHLVSGSSITAAQETYGLIGQVCAKGATLTHLHGGLMGTFEGTGAAVVCNSSYSIAHAGVIARIGGHTNITATTPLAGFLAFNNGGANLASGILAAYATSMASSSYPWGIGLYMPVGSVTQPIRIGNWAGSAATGSAIAISAVTDSADTTQRNLVAVYGESTADLGAGIHANVGRFRHLVNGITCSHESYGLVGQIAAKTVTFAHLHGGLMGTFEVNTAATVSAGAGVGCAGVIARVGGATITVGATGVLAGFLSAQLATTVSITSGGVHAAFACRKVGAGITWAEALHIEDALVAIRFKAADNSYAHGVKAVVDTPDTTTTHAIKVMIGTTAGYIPVYALETFGAA